MSTDSKLKDFSTTPASNNSNPPDGWPEGMAASKVNDTARENMARYREWYNDAQWINDGLTKTFVSGSSFKITGSDVTAKYSVGRRVEAIGTGTGTIYGTITATAFATDTTVSVDWDSGGAISNESLTISYHTLDLKGGDSDNAVSSNVVRDSAGRFRATDPSAAQDVATKTYVDLLNIENIDYWDVAPSNDTITLRLNAKYAFDIDEVSAKTSSGTISYSIAIDAVNVTGLASIGVSSSEATTSATAANSVAAGQTVTLVLASNSSAADLALSIQITRT